MTRIGAGAGRWMAIVAAGLMVFGALAAVGAEAASAILPCPKEVGSTYAVASIASVTPRPMNPCPGYEWAKAFGYDTGHAYAMSVDSTSDNGAVLLTRSDGDTPAGNDSAGTAQVVRLDANGTILWQRTYSVLGLGSMAAVGTIQETLDGGFVFASLAWTGLGGKDVVVYRLDGLGGILWQRAYGGPGDDLGQYVEETADGGYVIGGETYSFGFGGADLWVLRIDSQGGVLWQRTYGGPGEENFLGGVHQTPDGGYVVGGTTRGPRRGDAWVVRLDSTGGILWQSAIGGGALHEIWPTADGGYVLSMAGGTKWTVVKLTSSGSILWQKAYGTTGYGVGSLWPTADGGFVASATVPSSQNGWYNDFGVLRIDANGNRLWQRTYGGAFQEYVCGPSCLRESEDGNFLVAGQTYSFANNGGSAAWLLRVFADGTISSTCSPGFGTFANAPTVSNGKLKASATSFGTSIPPMQSVPLYDSASDGRLSVTTQCTA